MATAPSTRTKLCALCQGRGHVPELRWIQPPPPSPGWTSTVESKYEIVPQSCKKCNGTGSVCDICGNSGFKEQKTAAPSGWGWGERMEPTYCIQCEPEKEGAVISRPVFEQHYWHRQYLQYSTLKLGTVPQHDAHPIGQLND